MSLEEPAANRYGGLQIQGLSVNAGATSILSNINLTLAGGKLVALLGPSGAGKSTLMKCILGLRSNYRGTVLEDGRPLTESGPVGYVPQDDQLHKNLTVWQELDYAAQLRLANSSEEERSKIIQSVLNKVELLTRKHLKISKLSGGQKKRVSVALELITSPKLLILDEPTSGLDPNLESKMMQFFSQLAEEGRTVIVATHAMESIMLCDSVVLLMDGQLISHGSPNETLEHFRQNNFADIFKELTNHPVTYWATQYQQQR